MNITEATARYLENLNYATIGTDLYIGQLPVDAPDEAYVVSSSSIDILFSNPTGEKRKRYQIELQYRTYDDQSCHDKIEKIETELNRKKCIDYYKQYGYDILDIQAISQPIDYDFENRSIGTIIITLEVYNNIYGIS